MPTAQKYRILFGCVTFVLTVIAVMVLLTLGGMWKRIELQAQKGASATDPDSVMQRKWRALLLERFLENREWMMKLNYPKNNGGDDGRDGEKMTPLMKMLATVAPKEGGIIPEGYEDNYKSAYHQCQDKPGGVCTRYAHTMIHDSHFYF